MKITTDASFGIDDLTPMKPNACPVLECDEEPRQYEKFRYCPVHGLKIHKSTFVYYNGNEPEDKKRACLRNLLPFGRAYASTHILNNPHKAESFRLGYENSEDALTWNIFAGLLHFKRLHCIYNQLTGESSSTEQLQLFLWGMNIDLNGPRPSTWPLLLQVRKSLEYGIKNFLTEPDIMILGPDHMVCIEAKFTSGNPLAFSGIPDKDGEKPTSREGLIERYIRRNNLWNPPVIEAEQLGEKVYSQLLRMLVFTSTMAQFEKRNWVVANLISKTQWGKINKKPQKDKDFSDPTPSIPTSVRSNFRFISWEDDIHKNILKIDPALLELSSYMQNKTANLERAFEVSQG